MNSDCRVFQLEALTRVEHVYRKRLNDEPGDMVARLSLAWCLFMQALHRAGQESVLQAQDPGGMMERLPRADGTDNPECRESPDASLILRDCLHQTIAVMQLSGNPQDRTDVQRLQSLVRLSGGGKAVSDAEEDAARILYDVTREILAQAELPRTRVRRVAGG